MSILLLFLDALDAAYLSDAYRKVISQYQGKTIALAVIPRIGEKLILEVGTAAVYFEIADVIHRMAVQGRFQVDIYLKACLPPLQTNSRKIA